MTNPFIKDVSLVYPQSTGSWVVLERVEPGVTPEYCVHGRVTCSLCPEWCWLGDKTHDVVATGRAAPVCLQCAAKHFPRDAEPTGNLEDHRRADGPH